MYQLRDYVRFSILFLFLLLFLTVQAMVFSVAFADISVKMYSTANPKQSIGSIIFKDTTYGLMIIPDLHGLSPGAHGFHLHDRPSCEEHAQHAGGHYDPLNTQKHLGPYDKQGHLGDLPVLVVDKNGDAMLPIVAPRLTEKDLPGSAVIIHAGADNYSDSPAPLGGGGERVACGIIK